MYLPLAGLVVLAVMGAYLLLAKAGRRVMIPSGVVALSLVVFALAATTARRNHDYASGIVLLQTAVDRWPHGRARFNLATVLKERGRHDEAMAQLRIAVTDNPHAQYVLGSELYDRGQFDDAIAELRAFIDRVGSNPAWTYGNVAARNLVALSLAQQGKFGKAIEEFHVALVIDPHNPELHGNLGFLLLQQKNFAGARQQYEEYLTTRAGSAFVLTSLGVALQELGRRDEAKERFRQALVVDPNDAEARRRLDQASRPQ